MSKFIPDYVFDSIYDITPEILQSHGIRAVLIDLDGTMVSHKTALPTEEVAAFIRRLEDNLQLQKFYLNSYYPENLLKLDNEFHGILFDIARKSQVYTLIQSISIHFDRVRSMALATVKNQKIVEDHEGLIRCIERGQAQQARDLMEKHLNRYKIDAAEIRAAYPQYFK